MAPINWFYLQRMVGALTAGFITSSLRPQTEHETKTTNVRRCSGAI